MKFADLIDGRQNNLNLMRLIAASAVALSHSYNFTGQLPSEPLFKLTGNVTLGFLSVFIFFVISGLLVAQSFNRSKSVVGFFAARALRLYPALIIVLLLSAFVLGPFYTTLNPTDYLVRDEVRRYVEDNLLFKLNQGLPGVFSEAGGFSMSVNGSIWTLRYEVYAYLLLLLVGVSGLVSNRSAFNALMIACLLLYAKEPVGMLLIPGDWNAVMYVPLMGFIFGTLVYVNRDHIDCKISYAVICLLVYYYFRQHGWIHFIFAITLGYVVLTTGFHRYLQLHLPLPNDYSYGIYLYAFPVQQAIVHSMPVQSPLLLFAITMLITVPLAVVSWHLVEKPALKFKKIFNPHTQPHRES
ncbi:acyltransferase [Rhodoferax sp.]|uniref:acyltransferase family protein n=1 Tax=Rhodoferax sp. TaxID=50421 RepID=UPI00263572EE|nr:acyltransferase [Rhodoferax sp.]MDD2924968.1 acyltransferase [Rhodoferax sp.]